MNHDEGNEIEETSPAEAGTRPRLRWGAVVRAALPVAVLSVLAGGIWAADAWLPFFPREQGQRLTERFFRFLLIGYAVLVVFVPVTLALMILLLLRARRQGLRRPNLARAALLLGSALIAGLGMELTAAAWLAWIHRLPNLPTRFEQPEDGALSVVVIGGSSAMGFPYDPHLSVGKIVAWQLERALRGRRVVLDIRANLAKNLEDMFKELAKLTRHPDLLIVYSGHNEFLSRIETSRDAGRTEWHKGAALQRLYALSLHSPFCLWVYETARKHRLGGPPPPINQHRLLDDPSFTLSELHQIKNGFRRRLEAIVTHCEQIGTVPALVIPPANESGYEPNRTVLSTSNPARDEELTAAFQRAHELEGKEDAESARQYRQILSDEPDFSEAHFRLARVLERGGAYSEAREHYVAARDLDGFPVRCRTDFMGIYHDVAARHGSILVDAPAMLRSRTAHGILDDTRFHDAHHPSFTSHLAIAQAVLDRLFERRALGLGSDGSKAPIIDPAECAAHFKIDAQVWAAVCMKSANYFKHLAAARYDSTERLAKHARFMKATEDIRSGRIKPEDSGIPAIGLASPTNLRFDWWNAAAP